MIVGCCLKVMLSDFKLVVVVWWIGCICCLSFLVCFSFESIFSLEMMGCFVWGVGEGDRLVEGMYGVVLVDVISYVCCFVRGCLVLGLLYLWY